MIRKVHLQHLKLKQVMKVRHQALRIKADLYKDIDEAFKIQNAKERSKAYQKS